MTANRLNERIKMFAQALSHTNMASRQANAHHSKVANAGDLQLTLSPTLKADRQNPSLPGDFLFRLGPVVLLILAAGIFTHLYLVISLV